MSVRKMRLGTLLFTVVPWLAVACLGTWAATPNPEVIAASALVSMDRSLTVGDIGVNELAKNPAKKIKRFQPLADYLVDHLGLYGYQAGGLLVTKNMEDMAGLLKDGTIDIYMDRPYTTMVVRELSRWQMTQGRGKKDVHPDSSTYGANQASGIEKAEDLAGKVASIEEPFATSGYVLPAGTLIRHGVNRVEADIPDATVEPGLIGYYFSLGDKNFILAVFMELTT